MKRANHQEIAAFLEAEIVPLYDGFDAGHQRDHAHAVMQTSHRLAQYYPEVDETMLLVAAAYHDVGLQKGREHHHIFSAAFMRADERLRRWFTEKEIEVMADAAEDHRASSTHAPRTIYGRLVAESDRQIVPETVIKRTMQYTKSHFPGLDKEGEWNRLLEHLNAKYAEGGYLQLWIPESDNAARLATLRALIADRPRLRAIFNDLYANL